MKKVPSDMKLRGLSGKERKSNLKSDLHSVREMKSVESCNEKCHSADVRNVEIGRGSTSLESIYFQNVLGCNYQELNLTPHETNMKSE
jgi:hypothetical protein